MFSLAATDTYNRSKVEKRLSDLGLNSDEFFTWYKKHYDKYINRVQGDWQYDTPLWEKSKKTEEKLNYWIQMKKKTNPKKYPSEPDHYQGDLFNQ